MIEHFFFPKFSVSSNSTAPFAAAPQRKRDIHFCTMLHALPYHNPMVLASAIAATDTLTGGRYKTAPIPTSSGSERRMTSSSGSWRHRSSAKASRRIGITVNAGSAPHWMAVENQELLAADVIPRVRAAQIAVTA